MNLLASFGYSQRDSQHHYFRPLLYFPMLLVIFALVTPTISFATWYQGTAQATLSGINYDLDEIRTSTIERAIRNASFKSGVLISSEAIVLDGLLQSSKNVFKNKGDIRRVEILSESISGDLLTVVVNIDIDTSLHCKRDDYTKSVVVTQFPLVNDIQISNGGLFNLGSQASKRLADQLRQHQSIADSQLLQQSFTSINELITLDHKNTLATATYLAEQYNSQYIVFGYIQDTSLFEQVKDNLLIDDVTLRRNFTLQLYLYDAFQGQILINHRYHGEANWPFEALEHIDTNNSVFWRSDYGRVVLNTINGAVIDINDRVSCQKSFTYIINKEHAQLTINWGSKHGVKLGDKFTLFRKKSLQNAQGGTRVMLLPESQSTLETIHVNHHSSVLISKDASVINSSQIFDFVTPQGNQFYE